MTLPEGIRDRLPELRDLFLEYERDMKKSIEEENDDMYQDIRDNDFMEVFHDICELVEEAEPSDSPYLFELLNAVQQVLAEGTRVACEGGSDRGLHPMMPSWAHNDQNGRPLVPDRSDSLPPLPLGALSQFLHIFGIHGKEAKQKMREIRTSPWNASTQRHLKSTRLARFRPNLPPALTATPSDSLALSVLDARCEITSTGVNLPGALCLTESSSCLFMLGASGYKNRSPSVRYSFLGEDDDTLDGESFQPGLADLASHIAVDEAQCLVFVGDSDRVKSYLWGNPDGTYYEHFIPVHTLKSDQYSGPVATLPDCSIVRAGTGRAAVRDKTIDTHGDEGNDGYARLYDTRRALPALTFDDCGQSDSCEGVALAHPDGIPIVFTGSAKQENIKFWDVRARAAVYELSTGNNSVESLAWDSKRNYLYAATQCYYVDRMGYHHDYRRARIRNPAKGQGSAEARDRDVGGHAEVDEDMAEDQEGGESDSDDSFIDHPQRFWPDCAQHPEDWFGYMFDAGHHRIFRYAFKEDPDPSKLPGYGGGRPDNSGLW